MITFLSGGTGTPKLLRGMREVLGDAAISVIVNTAEDIWISGNHISPDVDTVLYLFGGILNTETWWGIRDDTFNTHETLRELGGEEFIRIGDRDRAMQILRGNLLREGKTLTECTAVLAQRLGVAARILPMSDHAVTTCIQTEQGLLHFQEYWVKHRGQLAVQDVLRKSRDRPAATDAVIAAIEESDAVVIGPSNPVTSISPILECEGVIPALRNVFVVAVSPFIGDRPVSGPAAELMRAWGCEASSLGTFRLYEEFTDLFVQDTRDPTPIEGAERLDTLMVDVEKSIGLSKALIGIISKNM